MKQLMPEKSVEKETLKATYSSDKKYASKHK